VKAVCSVACFEWIVWDKAQTIKSNDAQVGLIVAFEISSAK
jgi:hypothetical protein